MNQPKAKVEMILDQNGQMEFHAPMSQKGIVLEMFGCSLLAIAKEIDPLVPRPHKANIRLDLAANGKMKVSAPTDNKALSLHMIGCLILSLAKDLHPVILAGGVDLAELAKKPSNN